MVDYDGDAANTFRDLQVGEELKHYILEKLTFWLLKMSYPLVLENIVFYIHLLDTACFPFLILAFIN